MTTPDASKAWDAEYRRGGIPSSVRDDPSGVLLWTLSNWKYITGTDKPTAALDVGCGTGRNAVYMAACGISVIGIDRSEEAIGLAKQRAVNIDTRLRPTFTVRDLTTGLPAADNSLDLVADIFVYKHQLDPRARAAYRQDMFRVLKPTGVVLVSFADITDAYYSHCPSYEPSGIDTTSNPYTIMDMPSSIGSVLFRLEDMVAEMSDKFSLMMSWHKHKMGLMHGEHYMRKTVASLWMPNQVSR